MMRCGELVAMERVVLTVPNCPNAAAFEERLAAALAGLPRAAPTAGGPGSWLTHAAVSRTAERGGQVWVWARPPLVASPD